MKNLLSLLALLGLGLCSTGCDVRVNPPEKVIVTPPAKDVIVTPPTKTVIVPDANIKG